MTQGRGQSLPFQPGLICLDPGGWGGGIAFERGGDACRKFSVEPLRKRPCLNTNNSQGVDVIENFDNMNQVKKK